MVIRNVNLEIVCGITSAIPDTPYYEIAFAGKSNVGKSSLINALMNRKALARTSSHPGKTQTINFYNINNAMYLVDLPGYGYATANEAIKAKWGKMIENYLHKSKMLKAVFLLIDIRHDPSENDQLMYEWILEQGYAPIIIATKSDKISYSKLEQHIDAIREGLQVEDDTIILPFSAETKEGREEIWELIDSLVLTEEQLAEEALRLERKRNPQQNCSSGKKPRWKSTDKAVAKKTAKKQAKKKQEHMEAAKREKHQWNREQHQKKLKQQAAEQRRKERRKQRAKQKSGKE